MRKSSKFPFIRHLLLISCHRLIILGTLFTSTSIYGNYWFYYTLRSIYNSKVDGGTDSFSSPYNWYKQLIKKLLWELRWSITPPLTLQFSSLMERCFKFHEKGSQMNELKNTYTTFTVNSYFLEDSALRAWFLQQINTCNGGRVLLHASRKSINFIVLYMQLNCKNPNWKFVSFSVIYILHIHKHE